MMYSPNQVSIQIQDTVFGPVTAGSNGMASVPITVPPGIQTGETIVERKPAKQHGISI